ncbi:hypothetical protein ALC56_14102 [Trachymyrmex septentrionalis]|uniref:Uncharacterized protein n=1 Tax=Trachymyrmex septentrionalis TaxID=34720 RepID=A0A195EUP6_9HYME|nr:hypothetical protein ALC56_14102 [Trachymyrmex septentrionalis]
MPFHDTFHSLIHTNITLSNIQQRSHYFKSSLVGEAAKANANAWSMLKERR